MSKPTIPAMRKDSKGKVPNEVTRSLAASGLSVIAFRAMVYVTWRWDQHEREMSGIPRALWSRDEFHFSVSWRQLKRELSPESPGPFSQRDYRALRAAFDELYELDARREGYSTGAPGYCRFRFISGLDYDSDRTMLTYTVAPDFDAALTVMKARGFALVPIADTLALTEQRHLNMLLLVAMLRKIPYLDQRTFAVEWLREFFNLTGPGYVDWFQAYRKLKAAAEAVNEHTSFRVMLTPVKDKIDKRRMDAVRFVVGQIEKQQARTIAMRRPKRTISDAARARLTLLLAARPRETEGGWCFGDLGEP